MHCQLKWIMKQEQVLMFKNQPILVDKTDLIMYYEVNKRTNSECSALS